MAGTGIGVKTYVVKLSARERERLEALIGAGKRSAQLMTKARILLKADSSDAGESWTDREIAAAPTGHCTRSKSPLRPPYITIGAMSICC